MGPCTGLSGKPSRRLSDHDQMSGVLVENGKALLSLTTAHSPETLKFASHTAHLEAGTVLFFGPDWQVKNPRICKDFHSVMNYWR